MTPDQLINILQPILTNSLVQEAVLRGLISTHPDPARVREVAESLLMQAQTRLALSNAVTQLETTVLDERAQKVLDGMFRPLVFLPPDEG